MSLKQAGLRHAIAMLLLQTEIGTRLPTVRAIAEKEAVSVGAAHAVLAAFQKDKIITLEHQGHKGTFLQGKSVPGLWTVLQDGDPIVLALPLPTTPIVQGLASGIKELLADAGIKAFLIFLRGSRRRLEALRRGNCDAAVVSALVLSASNDRSVRPALVLPPRTYAHEHRVYYVSEARLRAASPLRVAVDRESGDLQVLTEMQFADRDVEVVPCTFQQYATLLAQGKVDAVVWDSDEAIGLLPPNQPSSPLSDDVLQRVGQENTRAVIVARHDDEPNLRVLKEYLPAKDLVRIRDEVVAGRRVPEY